MKHGTGCRSAWRVAAFLALGLSIGLPEVAQPDDPVNAGSTVRAGNPCMKTARDRHQEFGGFGPGSQDYWVGPPQFVAHSPDRRWTYGSYMYLFNLATVDSIFEAQIELPAGAVMTNLECLFYHSSPLDGSVHLSKHQYNYLTDTPLMSTVTSVVSCGDTGYLKASTDLNETIRYREGDFRNIYTLRARLPGNTVFGLKGCRISWRRSVTPAPAAATFADVAPSHGQFQFVEALAAAGITGGCGGGNFCPDAPLTRGQMAVFLSTALGLHFPF